MVDIEKAVSILKAGGLVGLPTETVYGLAGDASNEAAIRAIFAAKHRPSDHPLIVHIASVSALLNWASDVSEDALRLAQHFWPGPLTLILKKASHVSPLVTGGQDTIGLRIPNHPIAQRLLQQFAGGLAAPSANQYGRISPTTAMAVREEMGASVALVLEGGACNVGVESTIIDMSTDMPRLLRPGMILPSSIEAVLQKKIQYPDRCIIRVSGSDESHYAPLTATQVLPLNQLLADLQGNHSRVAVIAHSDLPHQPQQVVIRKLQPTAQHYAHSIYDVMRELDKGTFTKIFIESLPTGPEWDALRDRLQRASHKTSAK